MKLARIEVHNYRSLFREGNDDFTLVLSDGTNALIGPNNCGKSNVLRAVALALDPSFPFDREADKPASLAWTWVRVTLDFRCDPRRSYERTLLKHAEEYEQDVSGGRTETYASRGLVRLRVQFEGFAGPQGANRREFLVAGGGGNRVGDQKLLERALKQFHESVRFVLVESGQDLQSVLAGNFRDILHNVIREHLRAQFDVAVRRRNGYVEGLQNDLLDPLRDRIRDVVCGLFPEVTNVNLLPRVSAIDETLSNVGVNVTDAIETSLAAKGTGVRGAVLVAMLSYLADQTRRSLVFAVEEPEAFLHPAAQEAMRDDLEKLAVRPEVTVLMTTHSPFVVSREPQAKVIALGKDSDGRTLISGQAAGNEPHASLLGGLFRDAALPDILDRSSKIPTSAKGIVIVEGITDEEFIRIAAAKHRRPDLVDDLAISPAGGAEKAAVQAVLMRAQTKQPILVVLDGDISGREAYKLLHGRFSFGKKELLSIQEIVGNNPADAEAEDLFPQKLMQEFVEEKGEERVVKQKTARPGGGWRYDFNQTGKESIVEFVQRSASPDDLNLWLKLLQTVRERLGLDSTATNGAKPPPAAVQHIAGAGAFGSDAATVHQGTGPETLAAGTDAVD